MARCLSRFSTTCLLACLALAGAQAAELGEARVSSHIGQQLVADIELTAVENPAAPVQVRVANADVYRGANIAVPPVLSGMVLSVMQRDGRQYLHVTSLRPVEAEHLHLYLELVDGAHRAVRLSTLWLTPDPNPAPAPVPVAPPPVLVASPPVPVARAPEPVRAVEAPAAPPRIAHAMPRAAAARPARMPAPLSLPAAGPVACVPQVSAEVKACIALDAKNAALQNEIGLLEKKVKVLQVAMTPAPVRPPTASPSDDHAGPATPSRPGVAAGPAPALRIPAKPVAPKEGGLPWLAIGAGTAAVLAAAGGAFLVVRRRKATAFRELQGGIKSRLMPG
jgi:pilus assembly protein FimV